MAQILPFERPKPKEFNLTELEKAALVFAAAMAAVAFVIETYKKMEE